jgi:hypothetical protein
MIDPRDVHSDSGPKLVVNNNAFLNIPKAKTQEEQEFLDLQNEIGNRAIIDLAISLSPGRDFSVDPIKVAKDVICNLFANGGQESLFSFYNAEQPPNTLPDDPQDRIMIDY